MKRLIVLWAVPALQTKENEGDLCVFPRLWHSKQEHMCSHNTVNKQCSAIPQEARCDMQIANMLTSSTEGSNESTTESCFSLKILPLSQSSSISLRYFSTKAKCNMRPHWKQGFTLLLIEFNWFFLSVFTHCFLYLTLVQPNPSVTDRSLNYPILTSSYCVLPFYRVKYDMVSALSE